jgi:hypothetical protein
MASNSLNAEVNALETPDRSRPEFFVLWLEVEIMHGAGEVFGSFQSSLDERWEAVQLGVTAQIPGSLDSRR